MSLYNKWQRLQRGLVLGHDLSGGVGCCVNDVCTYQRRGCMKRERQIFPPKCLQRCKTRREGPWHRPARLTDWKQAFIFSNLWSPRREGSEKGRECRERPWEVKWRTSSKTNSHQQMSMRDARLTGTNGTDSISIWHVVFFRAPSSVLHSLLSLSDIHFLCVEKAGLTDR